MGKRRVSLAVVEQPGRQVGLAGGGGEHRLWLSPRLGQQPAFGPPFGHSTADLLRPVEGSLPAVIGRLNLPRPDRQPCQHGAGLLEPASGGHRVGFNVGTGEFPIAGRGSNRWFEAGGRAATGSQCVEPPACGG